MEVLECAKLKKNSLVYYKKFIGRKVNEISKNNLKQKIQQKIEKSTFLKILEKTEQINCINEYATNYQTAYNSATQKKYKTVFSKSQQNRVSEISNVFVQTILSRYHDKTTTKEKRMLTFVTLTIPTTQMHTDKVLIKTLVRFIDHLKKIKNYYVKNGIETKIEMPNFENYLWRAETTEKGNIHFHLLLDTYFNYKTMQKIWNSYLSELGYLNGMRSAQIHTINNLNDVGSYVAKYMAKEPLKDKIKNALKSGEIQNSDLQNIPDSEKYRRPIIGKSWGCSRVVGRMSYLTAVDYEIANLEEIKSQMREIELKDEIKEFVSVYVGNVRTILKNCSYQLQKWVKNYYQILFDKAYKYKDEFFAEIKREKQKTIERKQKFYQLSFDLKTYYKWKI